ncbi:MATE family efflux transporter [Peptostreptococcaceae bacterium AGR-M142]
MGEITKQKEIVSNLNSFSLPLIFNAVFNTVISSFMAAIVGRISIQAIASTQVVDSFIYALLGILGVFSLSFNINSSKVRLKDEKLFRNYFKSIFEVNFFIGLVFLVVFIFFFKYTLKFLYGFDGQVLYIGSLYSGVLSFSILFEMLIFAMSSLMKVRKKTKPIMMVGIISSILQLLITYIFVYFVFEAEYKIIGVALGSVICLFTQLISYMFILREDFKNLVNIKSTKKLFLLKKSIPLVMQEILEGAIFSVCITALISRLSIIEFSSYSVCLKVTSISFMVVYMYCNGIIIIIGESISKKDTGSLRLIPKISLKLILGIYFITGMIFAMFKDYVIRFFTDQVEIITRSLELILFIIIINSFQIFFEISKYSLQALGFEHRVLKITGIINFSIIAILIVVNSIYEINIYIILSFLASNYFILYILFNKNYMKEVESL